MNLIELWTICSTNNIIVSKEQMFQLERFHNEILHWNTKINLISRLDEENLYVKHILHSLAILKYIDIPAKSKCMDIGTGGGFPGIPLKIAAPEISMLLVDSIRKKASVAEMMAKHTGLRKITAICSRVEDLAKNPQYKNSFNFIFARAVARMNELVDWSKDLIAENGQFVFLKGGPLDEEIYFLKRDFPNITVEEIPIQILGIDWFHKDEKKIIVCRFQKEAISE